MTRYPRSRLNDLPFPFIPAQRGEDVLPDPVAARIPLQVQTLPVAPTFSKLNLLKRGSGSA
ncbi:MAG: hypothetical protein ACOYXO_12290 [Chloroflexota bacterium]